MCEDGCLKLDLVWRQVTSGGSPWTEGGRGSDAGLMTVEMGKASSSAEVLITHSVLKSGDQHLIVVEARAEVIPTSFSWFRSRRDNIYRHTGRELGQRSRCVLCVFSLEKLAEHRAVFSFWPKVCVWKLDFKMLPPTTLNTATLALLFLLWAITWRHYTSDNHLPNTATGAEKHISEQWEWGAESTVRIWDPSDKCGGSNGSSARRDGGECRPTVESDTLGLQEVQI